MDLQKKDIVENDVRVVVEYTGTLENGEVFDSSVGKDPLEFVTAKGMMIPGFEKNVLGMKVNEEKEFTITPEEAYGQYDEKLKHQVPKDQIPKDIEVQIGTVLALQDPHGHMFPAKVIAVDDTTATLDLNHMLAGKTLTFKIKVLEITEAPEEEEHIHGPGCNHDH